MLKYLLIGLTYYGCLVQASEQSINEVDDSSSIDQTQKYTNAIELSEQRSRLSTTTYKFNQEQDLALEKGKREIRTNRDIVSPPAKHLKLFSSLPSLTRQPLEELEQPASQLFSVFNKLSDEIILHVYSYLRIRDAVVLNAVSKKWYNLLNDPMLWKHYAIHLMLIEPIASLHIQIKSKKLVKKFATAQLNFINVSALDNGRECNTSAINDNGKIVVGYGEDNMANNSERAFYWTLKQGMQMLGTLEKDNWSNAYAISGDNKTIVGASGNDIVTAFRWKAVQGIQSLGTLNGGHNSIARNISKDGTVIVGFAQDGAINNLVRAFRWTAMQGMQSLGALNGGDKSSARGISADGHTIVGFANDGAINNSVRAFRWTAMQGMQSLGTLNGGDKSNARSISADGQVIVGCATDGHVNNVAKAFQWTKKQGMQSLGSLNNGGKSKAWSISGDNQIIVGMAQDGKIDNVCRAFIWTAPTGMQSLQDILITVLPQGWEIVVAKAISRDGLRIAGDGVYKDCYRSWIATIPRYDLLVQEGFVKISSFE